MIYVHVIPTNIMLTMWILGSSRRGRSRGKLIPTPMLGEPDMAPIRRGTNMAIAIPGTPASIIELNRMLTDPELITMSLR